MVVVPIRSDNAYFGLGKQSGQSIAHAPTNFFRWLDGSKLEYDMSAAEIWEGDGSRHLSQLTKTKQSVKMTLLCNPRPIELGYLECAAMGASSDIVTAATVNTTTSGVTNNAGATTLTLTNNTGLTASGTSFVIVDPGIANKEEIVAITTPGTGVGPYVYTIANSGTLKFTHSAGATVQTSTLHTETDQSDGVYYSAEVGLGSLFGANGVTIRITDCKVESLKRTSKAGGYLEYEVVLMGIASVVQGSPSTVLFENHNGFLFTQSNGGWTLNGSTVGDAVGVEAFTIEHKNNLDGVQTESLTYAAIIFGNMGLNVTADLVYQNNNLVAMTYFGSTSGTTDAQAIGAGNLTLVFTQADGFHTVTFTVTTLHYSKTQVPEPKKDGKAYKVNVAAASVSNQALNTFLLQVAVTNAQTTAY